MSKMIKNACVLLVITVVAGLCLGFVYELTKEPIAQVEEEAKKEAWQAVFPDADLSDFTEVDVDESAAEQALTDMDVNGSIDEVCTVQDQGYVITTTDKDGFGGDIQITVGITDDGTVNGVSILSISETAGLGMRAQEPSFYTQYEGANTDHFYVAKDGGEGEPIDALSGATITSRAVTGAVNAALGYYQIMYAGGGN